MKYFAGENEWTPPKKKHQYCTAEDQPLDDLMKAFDRSLSSLFFGRERDITGKMGLKNGPGTKDKSTIQILVPEELADS